jgi:hypothetical protein
MPKFTLSIGLDVMWITKASVLVLLLSSAGCERPRKSIMPPDVHTNGGPPPGESGRTIQTPPPPNTVDEDAASDVQPSHVKPLAP